MMGSFQKCLLWGTNITWCVFHSVSVCSINTHQDWGERACEELPCLMHNFKILFFGVYKMLVCLGVHRSSKPKGYTDNFSICGLLFSFSSSTMFFHVYVRKSVCGHHLTSSR